MKIKISASEARKNLGKFLDIVSLRSEEIIIERAGKPVAKLVPCGNAPVSKTRRGDFRETQGSGKEIWKSIDADSYIIKEREEWD